MSVHGFDVNREIGGFKLIKGPAPAFKEQEGETQTAPAVKQTGDEPPPGLNG